MKKYVLAVLLGSSLFSLQAAVIDFDLTTGGLRGANEAPAPNASPASGGEITHFAGEPSISYNDATKQLFLNFGWGSANSGGAVTYVDLTADLSGVHIHGPASTSTAASVLYDLNSLRQGQTANGRSDGVFSKTLPLADKTGYTVAQQEADLLAGLWYINVHSGAFPGGEIRGQLTQVPEPHEYALAIGLALAGFATYRRLKLA